MIDQDLRRSLNRAFIDREAVGSVYDPKIIINSSDKKEYLLNFLQADLDTCQDFFFSVAFITQSGLNGLKTHLSDLNDQGISGRLLTSDYLYFNQPEVFQSLLKIPNLQVRISPKPGFHPKGYLFNHGTYQSFIIGSSNLTLQAMKTNYEWNVRLTSLDHGELIHQITNHLVEEWNNASPLTEDWIDQYAEHYQKMSLKDQVEIIEETSAQLDYVVPNQMQRPALDSLAELRAQGQDKGLVISATGTGKTYLAAFDVANYNPDRMLFIVHREQILNAAMESFKKVVGGQDADYGLLTGQTKDLEAKYLFATIQTISKEESLAQFAADHFDYILVDEVHKAGAESYLRVLNYFEPDFLLGMTATPERTDDFNIFELFDYNIAYEIRLQDALEADLLADFHYFGVTDYVHQGQLISDTSTLASLVDSERIDYLIDRIEYYGVSGKVTKGLVFCNTVEEARTYAEIFNERGYPSQHLSGSHSIKDREEVVQQLERGDLSYIFTVDIFNEGIDIPMVNQVVLLRRTESSIIFIQQLGRGLRKHESKDFVTIIDFIGNYKNNYQIPMALTGDASNNKNSLRQDTVETNYISGLSTINFERIARDQIFKSIDSAKLDSMKVLRDKYQILKKRLNRIPRLLDFQESNLLEPYLLANKKDHYHDLLVSFKEVDHPLSPMASDILKFLSVEILPGQRLHEVILIQALMKSSKLGLSDLGPLFSRAGLVSNEPTVQSVLNTLTTDFYRGGLAKSYQNSQVVEVVHDQVILAPSFKESLQDDWFAWHVEDLLQTTQVKNQKFERSSPLTLYQKYRRRDILRLLGWEEQMVDQNIGGYTYHKDYRIFLNFITLDKGDDFQGAQIAYEDKFKDSQTLEWYTKAPRTLDSPEVQILKDFEGWTLHQFMKKSDDEGNDFYYLGQAKPLQSTMKQLEKPIKDGTRSVVELDLRLETPVAHNLYKYLNEF